MRSVNVRVICDITHRIDDLPDNILAQCQGTEYLVGLSKHFPTESTKGSENTVVEAFH